MYIFLKPRREFVRGTKFVYIMKQQTKSIIYLFFFFVYMNNICSFINQYLTMYPIKSILVELQFLDNKKS